MNAHLFLRRFRDLLKIVLTGRIFIELHEIKLKMNASTQNSNKIILTEKEQRTKNGVILITDTFRCLNLKIGGNKKWKNGSNRFSDKEQVF